MKNYITSAAVALFLTTAAQAELNHGKKVDNICASDKVAAKIAKTYKDVVGAPLPVVSRMTGALEVHVATSLENSVTVAVTPEEVKDIWTTIDAWGPDTYTNLVFTMGGKHVLDFRHKIPTREADLDDGWLDIYADGGAGVHGHLWLERVTTVSAIEIPGTGDHNTRAINFYGPDGKLAIGVYSSITTKEVDQKAVDGFYKTREYLAKMKQACK